MRRQKKMCSPIHWSTPYTELMLCNMFFIEMDEHFMRWFFHQPCFRPEWMSSTEQAGGPFLPYISQYAQMLRSQALLHLPCILQSLKNLFILVFCIYRIDQLFLNDLLSNRSYRYTHNMSIKCYARII